MSNAHPESLSSVFSLLPKHRVQYLNNNLKAISFFKDQILAIFCSLVSKEKRLSFQTSGLTYLERLLVYGPPTRRDGSSLQGCLFSFISETKPTSFQTFPVTTTFTVSYRDGMESQALKSGEFLCLIGFFPPWYHFQFAFTKISGEGSKMTLPGDRDSSNGTGHLLSLLIVLFFHNLLLPTPPQKKKEKRNKGNTHVYKQILK